MAKVAGPNSQKIKEIALSPRHSIKKRQKINKSILSSVLTSSAYFTVTLLLLKNEILLLLCFKINILRVRKVPWKQTREALGAVRR